MKRCVILLTAFVFLLVSCNKESNVADLSNRVVNNVDNQSASNRDVVNQAAEKTTEKALIPEKNPRKALEQMGFWDKKYYKLVYNPLYGYCYQHLFPAMDTSQEKDVISFYVETLPFDPMIIFVLNRVAYKNGAYELSGTINGEKYILYVKEQDGNTVNVRLGEYGINESYDLSSGIAYSSFMNTYNHQDSPVFDLSVYDTCEEQDTTIISDISDKLTDDSVKEQHGADIKTEKGLDCWGKWAKVTDKEHIYYELDKKAMVFKDYSEQIFSDGKVRTNIIEDMSYKNGIFYFNIEDNEMIGHLCLPIDNETSMWVLDDINLGVFKKYH